MWCYYIDYWRWRRGRKRTLADHRCGSSGWRCGGRWGRVCGAGEQVGWVSNCARNANLLHPDGAGKATRRRHADARTFRAKCIAHSCRCTWDATLFERQGEWVWFFRFIIFVHSYVWLNTSLNKFNAINEYDSCCVCVKRERLKLLWEGSMWLIWRIPRCWGRSQSLMMSQQQRDVLRKMIHGRGASRGRQIRSISIWLSRQSNEVKPRWGGKYYFISWYCMTEDFTIIMTYIYT